MRCGATIEATWTAAPPCPTTARREADGCAPDPRAGRRPRCARRRRCRPSGHHVRRRWQLAALGVTSQRRRVEHAPPRVPDGHDAPSRQGHDQGPLVARAGSCAARCDADNGRRAIVAPRNERMQPRRRAANEASRDLDPAGDGLILARREHAARAVRVPQQRAPRADDACAGGATSASLPRTRAAANHRRRPPGWMARCRSRAPPPRARCGRSMTWRASSVRTVTHPCAVVRDMDADAARHDPRREQAARAPPASTASARTSRSSTTLAYARHSTKRPWSSRLASFAGSSNTSPPPLAFSPCLRASAAVPGRAPPRPTVHVRQAPASSGTRTSAQAPAAGAVAAAPPTLRAFMALEDSPVARCGREPARPSTRGRDASARSDRTPPDACSGVATLSPWRDLAPPPLPSPPSSSSLRASYLRRPLPSPSPAPSEGPASRPRVAAVAPPFSPISSPFQSRTHAFFAHFFPIPKPNPSFFSPFCLHSSQTRRETRARATTNDDNGDNGRRSTRRQPRLPSSGSASACASPSRGTRRLPRSGGVCARWPGCMRGPRDRCPPRHRRLRPWRTTPTLTTASRRCRRGRRRAAAASPAAPRPGVQRPGDGRERAASSGSCFTTSRWPSGSDSEAETRATERQP